MIRSALAGVLSAAAGVAAAELVAAGLDRPAAAPVFAVGGTVIDATPTPLKEFAVRTVGTYDKPLLLAGIALGLVVIAAVIGVLARRRPWVALLGAVAFGAVGIAAAVTRPTSQPVDVLPSLAGALVMAGALFWTLRLRRSGGVASGGAEQGRAGVCGGVAPGGAEQGAVAQGVPRPRGCGGPRRRRVRRGRVRDRPGPVGRGGPGARRRHPAAARRPGAAAAGRHRARLLHPQRRLLPRRHRTHRARVRTSPTGGCGSPAWWTGRSSCPSTTCSGAGSPSGTSRSTASPTRSAARTSGPPAGSACRSAQLLREAGVRAGADQVVARGSDGMTIGTPVTTVLDTADAHAGRRHERRAAAGRPRLPGADAHAGSVRLRRLVQVDHRAGAVHVRPVRRLLGRPWLGRPRRR